MNLIDLWTLYFGDLTSAATKYMEKLNRVIKPGGKYTPPGVGDRIVPYDYGTGRPGIGQGGRVSQMMLDRESSLAERLFKNAVPSPIPRVPASGTVDRKVLEVKVSGDGLSPYIQRQVANALLEIERNASGG
jgi:hypothetical protein